MTSATSKKVGRTVLGTVAGLALLVNGGFVLVMLLWSCCGGLDVVANVSHSQFWGFLSAAVIALMSLPPVARCMRRDARRWWTVPFLLGSLLFFPAAWELVPEVGGWFVVVPAATAVCMIYVVVRVLCAPRAVSVTEINSGAAN